MRDKEFIENAIRTESHVFNPVDTRVLHAAMGLVTESVEILGAIKKSTYYGGELDVTNIKEEAGDILWYLAILFDHLGTSFEVEQARVINKLKVRFTNKFIEEEARDFLREKGDMDA